MCLLFVVHFKIFLFITTLQQFYYDVLCFGFLCIYSSWGLLSFCIWWCLVFYHICKFFSHSLLGYFIFCPRYHHFFSGILIIRPLGIIPHITEAVFFDFVLVWFLFFWLLSLCGLVWTLYIVPSNSRIFSSAVYNCY